MGNLLVLYLSVFLFVFCYYKQDIVPMTVFPQHHLFISLNFVSIGLLIIYFLTIYVLVLLNLLRRISKMTIRDFLYFDKQNEKKMRQQAAEKYLNI